MQNTYPTTISQLVPVFTTEINGILTQVCDARALHTYLESGYLFANWIKDRIEKYEFLENQDFILIFQNPKIKSSHGGDRRSKDYHLTLDMAKELAMVENNARGREVRQYFIRMERKALATTTTFNPANLSRLELLKLATQAEQERIALEVENQALKPKALALDRISASDGSQCITDAAKALKVNPHALFQQLSIWKWIYRRPGGKNWLGYQEKIQSGLLEHKVTTVTKNDGTEKVVEQVLITPKGITKLADKLSIN